MGSKAGIFPGLLLERPRRYGFAAEVQSRRKHSTVSIIPMLLCEMPPIFFRRSAFPPSPDTIPIGLVGNFGENHD
jgi:hypothetical protein